MALTVFTGIAKGGPLNGQVTTRESSRINAPGHNGFYVHRPASGATPGQWVWIEKKGSEK